VSEVPAGPPPAAKPTASPGGGGGVPDSRAGSALTQLLVIPSLIALACLGVMALFGLLASQAGPRSADECLRKIASGSSRERWQAAYGLVQYLTERAPTDPARAGDGALAERMVAQFRDLGRDGVGRSADDEMARRYLAVALGLLGEPVAVEALREAARGRPLPEASPEVRAAATETRLYATFALARIGDPVVVPDLLALANDPEVDVRKMAVYALGAVAVASDATAGTALRRALTDPATDVRWNAALALARRGDDAAVPLVQQLCDRAYLDGVADMTAAQRVLALQNGVRAARGLGTPALRACVERLAADDPDDRVRQEAREALAAWGTPLSGPGSVGPGLPSERRAG
jgi:HEAT repeat protein